MRTTALVSALVMALTGCAANTAPPPVSAAAAPSPEMSPPGPDVSPAPADRASSAAPKPQAMPAPGGASRPAPPAPSTAPTTSAKTAQADPKDPAPRPEASSPDVFILYTGDLTLLVDDGSVAPTIDRVIDAAIAAGGHIGNRKDTSVSVIVPSAAFRKTFAAVEGMGEVTHRSIAAEDVSEEYHDADVRLANLKATRKRLEEFLAKAPNIPDMLTVERELERVVTEVDRLEGRMRFLREHTAFSTLTVALQARPKQAPLIAATASAQTPPPPPPPPRAVEVPAKWLEHLGVDRLISGK